MRFGRGKSDGRVQIAERGVAPLLQEVQFTAILKGLPEARAEPYGFGKPRRRAVHAARRCKLVCLVQHRSGIGKGPKTTVIANTEIDTECRAQARDSGRTLELPVTQQDTAGYRQTAEDHGYRK